MGLYHLVWVVGCILLLPLLVSRLWLDPRYRVGLSERTGRVPPPVTDRRVVWIHGVSVGELMAAGTVIERLHRDHRHLHLVISTTTPTGHEVARRQYGQHHLIYFPLDFGLCPGRALDRIRPGIVLLMELEIWPNFLQSASRRGIPVAVINGRISERSFRGYRRVRGLLPELDLITVFCVQDRSYRDRLLKLGVDPERIHVTGNMKYDSVSLRAPEQGDTDLRAWLSPSEQPVLVCGSTHDDEEATLAAASRRVAGRLDRGLRLVLVPRHPERAASLRNRLVAAGLRCTCWSDNPGARPLAGDEILLVDTIGQLQGFYAVADVTFVGGSLVPHGGQNMLEPAALGKPVLFGPHVGNFQRDVELLLAARAVVQIGSPAGLDAELERVLRDPELQRELGRRAIAVIRDNQGATDRTLGLLAPFLGEPGPAPTRPAPAGGAPATVARSEHQDQDQHQADGEQRQGH